MHACLQTRQTMSSDSQNNGGAQSLSATASQRQGTLNVDLFKPRYDQSTYSGRAKHFFETANPANILATGRQLEEAAKVVKGYRATGEAPPGTTVDQLWKAKLLYDSAYHPDTGQKMFLLGRISCMVPANMVITGCLLTFRRHPGAVIFWQWANQTLNAITNYTNRSGDELITMRQLALPYVAATGTATATALVLNNVVAKRLGQGSLIARFVPFVAIAAANCINIPLMRQRELHYGIPIFDEEDNRVGTSKRVAQKGISLVVFSRILMAVPATIVPPVIMKSLESRFAIVKRSPVLNASLQVGLVGMCLTFVIPLCCAIFPQMSSMSVAHLEPDVREHLRREAPQVRTVYFNKGL